jgi:hypothetical protein
MPNNDILRKLPPALRIEIEENAQRKPLTESEMALQQRRILKELRNHKTPGARTDLKKDKSTSGKTSPQVHVTGLVGKLYGESRTQVEKRLAIVDAAEAEPAKFGKLKEDMDRTGRVNGPYKRLKVARQAAIIRAEPPPLPGRGPLSRARGRRAVAVREARRRPDAPRYLRLSDDEHCGDVRHGRRRAFDRRRGFDPLVLDD